MSTTTLEAPVARATGRRRRRPTAGVAAPVLEPWLHSQALNAIRHAAALKPFSRDDFGRGPASPSEGHVQAANTLLGGLRSELLRLNGPLRAASNAAVRDPSPVRTAHMLQLKDRAHSWVRATERIWDFYLELFGQRQSEFGEWLLGCDRIALDCYTAAFTGVGDARSVPAPGPFCYMRTGFSPATYRRGLRLARLGRERNPFPLIELPYHRMVNPWTLGAVLHEVSHNLQTDLGLDQAISRSIRRRLTEAGQPPQVVATYTRWTREMFADLSGLLLGGPAVVASLMDVVGRSPQLTTFFQPGAPHPTPYLRPLLSTELLRRMGFPDEADGFEHAWRRLYPRPDQGTIPRRMLETFASARRTVVDAVCFERRPELGGRSLAEVYRFEPKHQAMTVEAGRRLAAGTDPGVAPPRFLIGAARVAIDSRLARPGVIARNFYLELVRR